MIGVRCIKLVDPVKKVVDQVKKLVDLVEKVITQVDNPAYRTQPPTPTNLLIAKVLPLLYYRL